MGYDMHLRQVPEHLREDWEQHEQLEEKWRALSDRPTGDPEADAAWKALEAHDDPTYFRVSMGGIDGLLAPMDAAGMIARAPEPSWDFVAVEGIPRRLVRDEAGVEHQVLDKDSPEYRIHWEQVEYRHADEAGIAVWKLCSNEGWIVTAGECSEALAAWDRLTAEDQRSVATEHMGRDVETRGSAEKALLNEWLGIAIEDLSVEFQVDDDALWSRWLAWLRLAADGDGFVVW